MEKRFLCIGDSNGAAVKGWPEQLKKIVPDSLIINNSESARALGFDSCGKSSLNCRNIITSILNQAKKILAGGNPDKIILLLGTNDCKSVYKARQGEIKINLIELIDKIKNFFDKPGNIHPQIIVVTPPPMGLKTESEEKRRGGDKRVEKIAAAYEDVASKTGCKFVDLYHALKPDIEELTFDGIHLNENGSLRVAQKISENFLKNKH